MPRQKTTFGQSADLTALLSSLTQVENGTSMDGREVTKLATMFGLVDKEGTSKNIARGREEIRNKREERKGKRKSKYNSSSGSSEGPTFGSKSLSTLPDGSSYFDVDEHDVVVDDNNNDDDDHSQPSVDTFMARRLEHEIRKQDTYDIDATTTSPTRRPRPHTVAFEGDHDHDTNNNGSPSALDLFEDMLPPRECLDNNNSVDMRPSTVSDLNSQISSLSPKHQPQQTKRLSFSLDTKPEPETTSPPHHSPDNHSSPPPTPLPQIFNNITDDRNSTEFYADVLAQDVNTLYKILDSRAKSNTSPVKRSPQTGTIVPNLASMATADDFNFNTYTYTLAEQRAMSPPKKISRRAQQQQQLSIYDTKGPREHPLRNKKKKKKNPQAVKIKFIDPMSSSTNFKAPIPKMTSDGNMNNLLAILRAKTPYEEVSRVSENSQLVSEQTQRNWEKSAGRAVIVIACRVHSSLLYIFLSLNSTNDYQSLRPFPA